LSQQLGPVVCIVSGGLDSVCTAAYMAKEKKYQTYMVTFMYGQRAMIREIDQAKYFAKLLSVLEHQVIDVSFMKQLYGKTNSLTNPTLSLAKNFDYSVVVPVRNAIFITIAAAWAMSIHARTIAFGAHADDLNYPDCRPKFIKAMISTLNLAEEDGITLGLR
jgi:7-cyano-7-deazaguanine synthase